jgi:cell division protein FtsB
MQIKVTDLQHVVDRLERQLELNEKELVELRQSKDELGAELGEATEDAKNNEG